MDENHDGKDLENGVPQKHPIMNREHQFPLPRCHERERGKCYEPSSNIPGLRCRDLIINSKCPQNRCETCGKIRKWHNQNQCHYCPDCYTIFLEKLMKEGGQ